MTERQALSEWVERAQAGDTSAYGRIVERLQDMAVGYAASILGDFHLAEDAAQEAFIEAWRDLPDLHEPAAFAGWLRKIVFKQCDRLTRRKRLPTVPLDTAAPVADPSSDPAEASERREMRESVRRAIRALPEGERATSVLFYIGEYSQQEIAAFLGVAVVTVKKRLAAARARLRERMIALMQEELQAQRPSRDEVFAERALAFTGQFSEMIDAGISLVRCLTDLCERQDDEGFQQALVQIQGEVQAGQALSRAMAQHREYFDEAYVQAVRLGEVTGTLEFQLQRLATREAFDFAGDDNPESFRPESPTIAYLANTLPGYAMRRGVTEIHLILFTHGQRLDEVYLINGISQETRTYSSHGRKSSERYIAAALFARYKQMAGIDAPGGRTEGKISLRAADGKEHELPVVLHPTYTGEALVIGLQSAPRRKRRPGSSFERHDC